MQGGLKGMDLSDVDDSTLKFVFHNKKVWEKDINKKKSIVLVERTTLQHCIIAWSYFSNVLAKKYNSKIYTYDFCERKIESEIYASFGVEKNILIKQTNEQEIQIDKIYNKIICKLSSKKDLFELKIDGVWIGKEIYETYLSTGHVTVNLEDELLKNYIIYAIRNVVFWREFFKKNQISAVLISHDTYLLSIIRKIAWENSVPVYQTTASWGIKVCHEYPFGNEFKNYKKIYAKIDEKKQREGIEWAKKRLEKRFAGEVGIDMSYSRKSSFNFELSKKSVLRKNDKIKVLICSHCFFDNPHCYGDMLFLDFFEWLSFLGEISNRSNYDWYLKVHPDYRKGTIENINLILKRYPKIKFIPPDISHQQLVREGIRFVLTVYGTVGCEYPLMGVQVINAGNNPHIAYDFNWHPKTLEEYKWMLLNLENLNMKIDENEIYKFYFIHHIYGNYCSKKKEDDGLIFKSYQKVEKILLQENKSLYTSRMYELFLNEFSEGRHKQIIKNVEEYIDRMNRDFLCNDLL